MHRSYGCLQEPTAFAAVRRGEGESPTPLNFLDPDNRAHRGQAKIKSRLIADLDPDEWDLPPKPKWMRWRTYNRYVQKFDAYEDILNQNIAELMARFLDEG